MSQKKALLCPSVTNIAAYELVVVDEAPVYNRFRPCSTTCFQRDLSFGHYQV